MVASQKLITACVDLKEVEVEFTAGLSRGGMLFGNFATKCHRPIR